MAGVGRDRIDEALNKLEPSIRAAFLVAFEQIRSEALVAQAIEAIERGDIDAAFHALGINHAAFDGLYEAMRQTYITGGAMALSGLPPLPDPSMPGARVVARFDGRNPRAERVARELSSRLVTRIIEDQREAIRAVIEGGIEAGRGPRQTALDIVGRVNKATGKREGGIVGLNAPQAKAWLKAGDELDNLDPAYFERKLRDKRFDPMVKRAIAEGKPLSKADRERVLNRYSDRLLRHRGEVIARTETISSLNAGRDQGIRQLIESGNIRPDQVTKVWDATLDSRTRPNHAAMEGQRRRFDEPFVSPEGYKLMNPGDASLGAPGEMIISCRCLTRYDLDFFSGLK